MSFNILGLPAEIRLEIYHLVLVFETSIVARPATYDRPAVFIPRPGKPDSFKVTRAQDHLRLLLTCRQINAEALPVFYGHNKFVFTYDGYVPIFGGYRDVMDFIGGIGPLRRSLLSDVTVFAHALYTSGSTIDVPFVPHIAPLVEYLKDSPGLKTRAFKIYGCCTIPSAANISLSSSNAFASLGLKLAEAELPIQGVQGNAVTPGHEHHEPALHWFSCSICDGEDDGNESKRDI